MKNFILALLLFTITFTDFAQCTFKNIGHRGGSSYYYPENTLLSMEQAFLEGAWACEVDVVFTKDSVLVLLHDDFVDRTSNGYGNVTDMTLSEIQNLDAGSWKNPRFAGEKIPTLVQAMQLAHQFNKKIYLNMKVYQPQMIASALAQSGVPPDVILIDPDEMYKVIEYHTLMPNTPLVYFGAPPDPITDVNFYQTLIDNNVIAAELYAGDILDTSNTWTIQFKNILHSYGLELWAYTVNDNGYLHRLKDFGIDGLETDRPAEAKNVFCYNLSGGFFPEKRITAQWDFINHNLDATIGAHLVERGDTTVPNQRAIFGTTDDFEIPYLNGVNSDVMKTPAYDADHNLVFFSNIAPQGNPGGLFCDNDYTLIMDILIPASNENYISLFQTSNNNSDDGDLFIRTADSSIGISGNYFGPILDSTWYRLAAVFDLPHQILNLYLNGNPIGTVPLINSLDGRFCLNNNWGIQPSCLFSDDDGETSELYISSIQLRDYAMSAEEITVLGDPVSAKISTDIIVSTTSCPQIPAIIPDISVCEGTNTIITASTGDTVNYRWQINNGNGWTDLHGLHYTQQANDTLVILNCDTSMNNVKYRCMINTNCYVYTEEISLHVLPVPEAILTISGTTQLCTGDSALLFITIDSSASINWYQNNILITSDTSNIIVTQAGNYHVVVSDLCGTDTSSDIIFSSHESVIITSQPSDQNITTGSNALFFISATGDGLQFQWQADTGTGWHNLINDIHFINTTSAMLGVVQTTISMDGYRFRCLINGYCSSIISDSAFLNINLSGINLISENIFSLYPNPNDGNFQILFAENPDDITLNLYTASGGKINLDIKDKMNPKFISLQIPSGIYILESKSKNSIQRKIISIVK